MSAHQPDPGPGSEESRSARGGPDRTLATTVIAAAPTAIMAVIADFDAYPEWTRAVQRAEVLSTGPDSRPERVSFVLDAGIVTDEYVLRYSWSADGRRVQWRLEGPSMLQSAQSGSYVLTPVEGGTEVTYELEVELTVATIGRVRDRAERRIVGAALSELRRRVETDGEEPAR